MVDGVTALVWLESNVRNKITRKMYRHYSSVKCFHSKQNVFIYFSINGNMFILFCTLVTGINFK